jgi:hypothetical protein
MMIPAGTIPAETPHPMRYGRNDGHHHDQHRNADEAKFEKVRLGEEPGAHGAENDRRRI